MLKIQPATAEEYAFAAEVNKRLTDGARVTPSTVADPANPEARPIYRLTFQLGSKRTTITSDAPFYLDPPEDVVKQVTDWIAGIAAANRWSTDPKDAE